LIALGRGGQVGESRGPALFFFLDSRAVADLVIGAVIVLGAIVGFRKGFVMPLVAQGGALLSLAALYAGPLSGALPSGTAGLGAGVAALFVGGVVFSTVGSIVIGVIHRFSLLERFDKVLGIPLGMATAAVSVYVALLGTIALDGWLGPLHGKTAIGPKEVAAFQALASTNPTFAAFADPAMLKLLAQSAAKAPVPSDQLAKFDGALAFYEQTLRPELLQSKIAPVLLAVGENLPFIGRPATLPAQ